MAEIALAVGASHAPGLVGGGTTELLAWVDVLGAIGEVPCESLGYTAYPDWKCGVGAVRWDLSGGSAPARAIARPAAAPEPAAQAPSLAAYDPALATHDLVQDLKWDAALRDRFSAQEGAVLDRYALRGEERAAIERRDFRALYDMGLHPYLGGQLARLIYGNAAGSEATLAARKLVASLTGEE